MNYSKWTLLFLAYAFIFTACQANQPTPISFSDEVPYHFDFGNEMMPSKEYAVQVAANASYTQELGYGWTSQNTSNFFQEKLTNARDAILIDGVEGNNLSFKADIPAGKWQAIVWFESGLTDSVETGLSINGNPLVLNLQYFSPHAEARTSIQKNYRVIQRAVEIEDSGIEIRTTNEKEPVILLAVSLIPLADGPLPEKSLAEIKKAGVFNSDKNLDEVVQEAAKQNNPALTAYWETQVQILQKGEEFFYLRGWSWATDSTNMSLFDHLHQSVMLFDGILDQPNAEKHPLYERALWYRGRLLYWLFLERGGVGEGLYAKRDLAKMLKLYPDEQLVGMYNGLEFDLPDAFDNLEAPKNAPEWAKLQWETLNRLKDIADWWVNEQQSENGEFGGKFGDDVEILRWWPPLILTGDKTAYLGWKRLADGVWNSNKVKDGYAKKPSDVEHSSEYISDTAPQMVIFNDSEEYADRLAFSAEYFANLWSGINDSGNRHFKSAWFSSSEVELEIPKNRDVTYNSRAMKAVRYYAWKTKDQATIENLIAWADSWLVASASTEKGKPVGIPPPSVEWPTAKINGDEPTWYLANMYWDYFDFNGSVGIYDQLLFTWKMTQNEKYLQPMMSTLELLRKHSNTNLLASENLEIGSEAWAANVITNKESFWSVVATWRFYSGDDTYDDLLKDYGGFYVKYRLTNDERYLEQAMLRYLESIRYNKPMFTTEAIHTDRVYITKDKRREAIDLQAMITGDGIAESASPYGLISWEKASREVTFLVTDHTQKHLEISLYSFADAAEEINYRLWNLEKGTYSITLDGSELDDLIIAENGTRGTFSLPNNALITLRIEKKP